MIEAVLFDLGNVLLPIDFGRAFAHWGRVDGISAEGIRGRFTFDAPYHAQERGEIDAAAYFAHLRGALGLRQGDADLLAGWNAIFLEPLPEVQAMVAELSRRYPLYLFSNTNRTHQAWWSPRLEAMLSPFKALYTSCDIGLRKPDPEAFLHVAGRMGVAPGRIAFFDDSAENVEGARRAGLQAFHFRSVEDVRRALP